MSQRQAWAAIAFKGQTSRVERPRRVSTAAGKGPVAKKAPQKAVDPFLGLCRAARLPVPVQEYRFAAPRRWRFDYAWPDRLVALEVEGGIWTGGRHTRGAGFEKDIHKYNAAALVGWRLFRTTPAGLPLMLVYLRPVLTESSTSR
jgi:hypothetical protein